MAKKIVMQGNEALAESALRAGCTFYAGYPITPQTEITEYLAMKMPKMDRTFIQAESEVASVNMLFGAGAVGARVMTATAGQGLSLMTEGMSQILEAGVPAVIVDVMRGGAGNCGIGPSQGDYNFATKGLGHGGYRAFVFGPSTVQETADMVYEAFEIADKYRVLSIILTDGTLGHLMETVDLKPYRELDSLPERPYIEYDPDGVNKLHFCIPNLKIMEAEAIAKEEMYEKWEEELTEHEEFMCDDAEFIIAAWGTVARVAKTAVRNLRADGIKVGIIRPKTLHPFPYKAYSSLDESKIKHVLSCENAHPAQFYYDVKTGLAGKSIPLSRLCRGTEIQLSVAEIEEKIREIAKEVL